MKKILSFSGSNSSKSINKQLVDYIAQTYSSDTLIIDVIDIRDYDVPMYSQDLEATDGIPQKTKDLFDLLKQYEGFIFATPEYNGYLSSFFKNIFD